MKIIDKHGLLKELIRIKYEEFAGDKRKTRAIDKLIEVVTNYPHIEKKQTADVVEIVRCKDCVYRTSGMQFCQGRRDDWFCAKGEKKEIGNTVRCKDCKHLELELPYGVCGKAYKGIVNPDDCCGRGEGIEQ